MGNEQIDGTQQNELSPVIILNPYSTLNSEQLDQKISELVAEAAKAEGDLLDAILPVFEEMRDVLNQRGSPRNKHGKQTFGAWRDQKIKEIKSSPMGKDIAISSATLYRRMAKKAGCVATLKPLKYGTLVREKGEDGDLGESRTGRVENGKLAPAEDGFTNVRFFDESGKKMDAVRVERKNLVEAEARPRNLKVGDVMNHLDIDGGTLMRYDGQGKWSKVKGTLSKNERERLKLDAKKVKKEKKKLDTGATPGVGGNPGQVSDAKAAENAKRHKPVVVTPKLVKAEDSGAKKTTITDTTIVGGKPGPTYGEVIQRDILKPAPKPKAKPGPKPKVKTVAPSPDSEPRKGFEVQTSREYDPELGEYVAPEPDAHREKLIAGAAPAGVEPITTEETAA